MPRRHLLALDLRDDPAVIEAYERHHRAVWPEIEASIRRSGIQAMSIHRLGIRLVMVIDVTDDFTFEAKAALDGSDPAVRRWEAMMEEYQDVAVGAGGGKWRLMTEIYTLPVAAEGDAAAA